MSVSAGSAALQVVPELSRTFSRQLLQQMHTPATRAADQTGRESGRRFGTRFGVGLRTGLGPVRGVIRTFGASVATAFAGIAVAGFLKSSIDEAREAQKVGRQTAAVLKATGGVAKVSARDVDRLADRLSTLVGVDDEIIAAGQNMLLTFKGVRNEVGQGNDVFNQATAVALDMTAALNQGEISQGGLEKSTIRLGKALNDPIKGVTALTRVGVTFTDKQKDQIKTLVESGRTMDAQKIILGELKSEFGGAAAAAADPWQRFGVLMANIKERIGTVLLPALTGVFGFLTTTLIPGIERFARRIRDAVGPTVGGLTEAIQERFDTWKLDAKLFGQNLAARIKGTANAVIGGFLVGLRTGDWSQLGAIIGNILRQAVGNGIDLMKRAFGAVDWFQVGKQMTFVVVPFAFGFFDSLLSAFVKQFKEHPWESTMAVLSLIPFGRAAGVLAKALGRMPILGPLLRVLERAGGLVEKPVLGIVGGIVRFFGAAIERAFPGIGRRIGDWAVRWILGISSKFGAMRKAGGGFIRGLVDGILDQAGLVIRNIAQVIAWLTRPFRAAGSWLIRAGVSLIGGLVRGIAGMVGSVVRWVGTVISRLTSPFRAAGGWLVGRGHDLISGLVGGIRSAIGSVGGVLRSLKDAIIGGIKRLFGISSPSRVMAGLGASMVAGLVRGLITNQGSLQAIIKSIGGNVVNWFGAAFGGIGQGGTRGNLQKLAQRMAAGYGWTGAQWNALRQLIQNESGWNPNAQNPTSTAYGLGQFLNSTWATVGAVKTSNPVGQLAALYRYIKKVYGSPAAAWSAWLSRSPHWYGQGLEPSVFARPTLIGVGEAGPEAVSVTPLRRRGMGDDLGQLAKLLADELRANPPVVELDGQRMSPLIRKQLRSLGYRDGIKVGG